MKIAHIVSTFPPYKGGMGNAVYHFAKILAERGHDITVLTPDYGWAHGERAPHGMETIRLRPLIKYGNAAFVPQLLWELKGVDVVHLHYPFYGAAEALLIKKVVSGSNMKLVVFYHMDTIAGGFKGAFFRFGRIVVLPALVRRAEAVTCGSLDYVRHSDVADLYKLYDRKFHEILYGVDTDRFKPLRSGDGPGRERRNILFVGGLDKPHYFKGLENLIRAFKALSRNNAFCDLTVAGSGDMESYYRDVAITLQVDDRVKFLGKVSDDELVRCYRNADVVVLPSINRCEAFGLVLLEAMASSRPVVASDLPGVRDVFQDGSQGLLVKTGDLDDLAEKLSTLIQDDELARRMGAAGRELVEKKYTWEKVGDRLEAVYKGVMK